MTKTPHETELVEKYADKGFILINICMEATVKQWQTALQKFPLHGVNVSTKGNWERKLKEAYAVDAFPYYALIDQHGKIIENQTHRPSDPPLAEFSFIISYLFAKLVAESIESNLTFKVAVIARREQ